MHAIALINNHDGFLVCETRREAFEPLAADDASDSLPGRDRLNDRDLFFFRPLIVAQQQQQQQQRTKAKNVVPIHRLICPPQSHQCEYLLGASSM